MLEKPLRLVGEFKDFITYRHAVHHFIQTAFRTEDAWSNGGSVRETEYPLLKELCEQAGNFDGPIVEIGTLFGFATTQMALWKKENQKIITVDNYCWNPLGLPPQSHYQLASRVLEYLKKTRHVEQINQEKKQFFEEYRSSPPAMVFLDADHSYQETKKDIEWAKTVEASIICGHDYSDQCPGVKEAVDEFGGPSKASWLRLGT